jgi:hypothetical protein
MPPVAVGAGVRFSRWARRTTIRAALILVALGSGLYFAHPHLPAWAKQPIDRWLRRAHVPVGSEQSAP